MNWYSLAMNIVSSSDVPPSQTQPGLLATAVPHSIPIKVCTLSPSLLLFECGSVCMHFCDVMMSLQVM